ncbi:MAG: NAD+ synthase [Candidatus Cloacimonetes bacterium]|nr:NAD+ synthase [Candidatus Cloacimonadota bacterium]
MRNIDFHKEIEKCSAFLRDYLQASGQQKYILGVSGGIDSALSAALAAKAIGSSQVIGVSMPYSGSNPTSREDAELLCKHLGIQQITIDISPMVDAYFEAHEKDANALRRGNWMARVRMCVLFDLSVKHQALVLGTTNQSEYMTGYFTQYGDSAAAVEPIGQLYKTEVWAISKAMGLPEKIISKLPTADLWEDQTDEQELGISYQKLDEILWAIRNMDNLDGYEQSQVYAVYKLIAHSAFKRSPAPMPDPPCSL